MITTLVVRYEEMNGASCCPGALGRRRKLMATFTLPTMDVFVIRLKLLRGTEVKGKFLKTHLNKRVRKSAR